MKQGLWFLSLVFLAGCASNKQGHHCPDGYMWAGDTCAKKRDISINTDMVFQLDEVVKDQKNADQETLPDIHPRDPLAPATIGASCQTSADCNGIATQTGCVPDTEGPDADCVQYNTYVACLNNEVWKDGYCGLSDCVANPCPEGSVCVAVGERMAWCVAPCQEDGDCRVAEGYRCKTVKDNAGELTGACLPTGKGDTGAQCKSYTDCKAGMDCLTNMKNGYCSKRGCSADNPCADGDKCMKLNDGDVCLKTCDTDEDCRINDRQDLICVNLHSAVEQGEKYKVCVQGSKDKKKVGDKCVQDYDCATGKCMLAFTGQCKRSGRPCNSNDDCVADFCDTTDPKFVIGFCTKDCSLTKTCTGYSTAHSGPSVCLQLGDGKAWCMPPCIGQPCTISGAMDCVYGWPLSGQRANFYCEPTVKAGDWGSYCTADTDCNQDAAQRECLKGKTGYGYCTGRPRIHNGERVCPFPTRYGEFNNRHICLKYCRTNEDCMNLPNKPGDGTATKLQCRPVGGENFCVPVEDQ